MFSNGQEIFVIQVEIAAGGQLQASLEFFGESVASSSRCSRAGFPRAALFASTPWWHCAMNDLGKSRKFANGFLLSAKQERL